MSCGIGDRIGQFGFLYLCLELCLPVSLPPPHALYLYPASIPCTYPCPQVTLPAYLVDGPSGTMMLQYRGMDYACRSNPMPIQVNPDPDPDPDPNPNPNPNPNPLELVWRYLLEVTNTVNPSSIPGSTLKNCSNPNPHPDPNPNPNRSDPMLIQANFSLPPFDPRPYSLVLVCLSHPAVAPGSKG